MRAYLLLFLSSFACAPPPGGAGSSGAPDSDRPFALTIIENRTDRRETVVAGESPAVTVESELTLSGRVEASGGQGALTFYADSISFDNRQPYAYRTFMSADTMYYWSVGGVGVIDRSGTAEYDSMLSCLFGGPALQIFLSESGAPDSTAHANERCRSGEYDRINTPVTIRAFLVRREHGEPGSHSNGERWRESLPAPSFSGVGFHPSIEFLYRVVKTTDASTTVAVAADTTIEDHRTVMKNGEEVIIARDRFRIGGTLVIDGATGITRSGELRIRESLKLIRPHASGMVMTKDGEYTIRFTLL
jgi:hypothetical protein